MARRYRPDPNRLQGVQLDDILPSERNVRLYIERESLIRLEETYRTYRDHPDGVVLPDPPIVRILDNTSRKVELLSGHRRVQAAWNAGLTALPCRVVEMSDEEAYLFIVQANRWETLTVPELAYRAYQMQLLGFLPEQIQDSIGQVGLHRYLAVGALIDPDSFTDHPKQGVAITYWFEAARLEEQHPGHFARCFHHWNYNLWSLEECIREFRGRTYEKQVPLDNKQKGVRLSVSKDGRFLNVIGRFDLDLWEDDELLIQGGRLARDLVRSVQRGVQQRETLGFGTRRVTLYTPDTVFDD